MGVIISLPLSGVLAEHFGWEYVFYVTGGLAVTWAIVWICLVSDSPDKLSRISQVRFYHAFFYYLTQKAPSPHPQAELSYIEANISKSSSTTTSLPPFKKMFASIAFWATTIAQIGNYWGYFTMMTGTPLYLSSILHTSIQEVVVSGGSNLKK